MNHKIRTSTLLLASLLWFASALPALAAPPLPATDPPQPIDVRAAHRSGQTFVTWTERADLQGERYRIYRSSAPIDADHLGDATLLYEVAEGTGRFFANRYYRYDLGWAERYVQRYVIQDREAPLPEGVGLLVWTLADQDMLADHGGGYYYAVTTVIGGNENRTDFGVENTAGPLEEDIQPPAPVEIAASLSAGWHAFIQYMDLRHYNPTFHAPNGVNSYYGLDRSEFGVAGAIQYAYDYAVFVPGSAQCGSPMPDSIPVELWLHPWQGNAYPPPGGSVSYCAYKVMPVDVSETWWFGFAEQYDYRLGGRPPRGDSIANYTEERVLRMVADLIRQPPGPTVDANRIYVDGYSMGASGALAFALRYANVFAAAYASKPMTNYLTGGGWSGTVVGKWGDMNLNLPVAIRAPEGWASHLQRYNGTGVWDWQNHQENLRIRQSDEMVPFGIAQGINDTSIVWDTQGQPAYSAFNAARRAWGGVVTSDGHAFTGSRGLPPSLQADSRGVPYAGLRVTRDETVPGLSNASSDPAIPPTTTGGYNQTILWSSSWNPWDGDPVDEPKRWQMSLCSASAGAATPLCGTGITQTVDVTPRRTQQFVAESGALYLWQNQRVSDDAIAAGGLLSPDSHGLLTVSDFEVTPGGNRLVIRKAAGLVYLPYASAP